MKPQELMNISMEIGMQMLESGAEVNRVEDTIERICKAYNVANVEVFTITSAIIITIQLKEEMPFTQMQRVGKYETNLEKMDKLNSLSRYICKNKPSYENVKNAIKEIENNTKRYPEWVFVLIYGILASVLAGFYGGDISDFITSAYIGAMLRILLNIIKRVSSNYVILNAVVAFIAGSMAVFAISLGIGHNIHAIITGNMMLLIQGVVLTNSMRDMINGDIMSGMLRFIEAIIGSIAVAIGFVFATVYIGGIFL